jgi:hypothetical protein
MSGWPRSASSARSLLRSTVALDELQDELEAVLRSVVIGLRREHLKRHPPSQDDKVVAVKTAQSA